MLHSLFAYIEKKKIVRTKKRLNNDEAEKTIEAQIFFSTKTLGAPFNQYVTLFLYFSDPLIFKHKKAHFYVFLLQNDAHKHGIASLQFVNGAAKNHWRASVWRCLKYT